jgi:hypothetical protein
MMIPVSLKKERPRKAQPSNDVFLWLLNRPIDGVKKPARRNGQKVGILGSNETKALLIVRATDLPGSIHFCRYVL